MYRFCHRCGEQLPVGSEVRYCPQCGAPHLQMAEGCSIELEGETDGRPGAPPPPRARSLEWKSALQMAGGVAVAGVVLNLLSAKFPQVSAIGSLWIFGGPLLALGLYQRRQPKASITAGVGARIGLAVGLGTVVGLAVSLAVIGVVARFGLHRMGGFDTQMAAWMKVQVEHAMATNPTPKEMVPYFYSPEFQAGFVLLFLGISAMFLLMLATLAGALGGLLRARRVPLT